MRRKQGQRNLPIVLHSSCTGGGRCCSMAGCEQGSQHTAFPGDHPCVGLLWLFSTRRALPDVCQALSTSLAMKSGMPVPQVAPCSVFLPGLQHILHKVSRKSLCAVIQKFSKEILEQGGCLLPVAPAHVGKSHVCCWEVSAVSAVVTTPPRLGAHQVWPAGPGNQSAHVMALGRSRGLVA